MRPTLLLLLLAALSGAEQDTAGLDALLERCQAGSWQERWKAVEALARLPQEDVFALRPLLLRDPRPRVREAVVWACLLDPALGNATLLGIVLRKDPEPAVRRAAARALVHFPDRRAVAALVEALPLEPDGRTRLHIVETLRALTPAPCLLDPASWQEWWRENAGNPRFAPADEAPKTGTYEGVVLETRTVAPVRPRAPDSRRPCHLLVLPSFGWTTAAFGPYLLPLRRRAALSWVSLPGIRTLTGHAGYGDDVPVYPVDRLVVALDAFRASLGLERFVLLAPGASGWIAMRYAQLHPDRTAGLILIDTALDRQAYAESLERGAAHGDAGERFVARTLLHREGVPFTPSTLERLQSLSLERAFLDRADLEIGDLWRTARAPQGFATVPDLVWGRHARIDLPALFLYSGASPFSGHVDDGRIRRHFPRALVAPIDGSRNLPYIERSEEFHRVIGAFLDRLDA